MKNLISTFFILFITTLSFSQTTNEEYKYLTEGYAAQLENGLDVYKEGYELKQFFTTGNMGGYEFDYYTFKHIADNKLKAVLIVAKKTKKDKVRYLVIPYENNELILKAYEEYKGLGIMMKETLDFANIMLLGDKIKEVDAINNPQ